MHDDWTIATTAAVPEREREREVSNFHTEEEARQAAIEEEAKALAEAIRADPGKYISVEAVHEPDDGR